jgi:hydrogenase nickel incorporation protein HypB
VLDANDAIALANREKFDRAGVFVVNMMSSPGAGKTTILERTLERLQHRLRLGVLEGDVRGTLDADRLARFHAQVAQVNTDPGFGGECHLDANMVRHGLTGLPLDRLDLLIIENVGNLVCPAEFKVGEDCRVMVFSITEGEDKPLKYPLMFRSVDLVLINKLDLLPHLDVELSRFEKNLDAVNPGVERIRVSARTGEGIDAWCEWLLRERHEHQHKHGHPHVHEHADEHEHEPLHAH